ncbi:chemotaxis protein [Vibrio sp. 10N.286.49.B3]|uniref:YggN family protein n=1 Tax=Vibrio sp. 10N.286.49.B3 TaxID=1880855 RepID=UPI000C826F7F|nr:YggN family protein [Vibrio sp. 10N.286.49.B3]PMH41136.1 chemotaxis protein [Vibrio sp. 10N.286.49.B3]
MTVKKLLIAATILSSANAYAMPTQCQVDIENEVHLDGEQVEIYQENGAKVLIDENNQLFINGKQVQLDELQQQAIEAYRYSMNTYVPKAKELAQDGMELANSVIDDVADSFNDSQSFENVKVALGEFFTDIESRYYQNDELVLKKDAFGSFFDNWQDDLAKAQQVFNSEFFSSAFNAMSEKMNEEGSFNFSELADNMAKLKESVTEKAAEQSKQIQQDAKDYCDSLDKVAEQEQQLHQAIPQLKDYQVFTI